MGISLTNIKKSFGDYHALNDISLEIKSGELVALLGPSGSGKTTLLRIIAGLERADSGSVLLDGEETVHKSVGERGIGFVFQHYALFKHMTIFENVAFGLRVQNKTSRPDQAQIRRRVLKLLKMVRLEGFHSRYPAQLSGGQRQRVALARALAVQPKVLLLDEPFGALDAKVRKELRRWIRRLQEELRVTSIFVTHDQEEAMEVADRVVVMSNGRIEQVGSPNEVWNEPRNGFVYDFLGNYNEFEGWQAPDGKITLKECARAPSSGAYQIERGSGTGSWTELFHQLLPTFVPLPEVKPAAEENPAAEKSGKPVKLFARPHEMAVTREANGNQYLAATIVHINPAGPLVKLELERANGDLLQAEVPAERVNALQLEKKQQIFVRPTNTRIFA